MARPMVAFGAQTESLANYTRLLLGLKQAWGDAETWFPQIEEEGTTENGGTREAVLPASHGSHAFDSSQSGNPVLQLAMKQSIIFALALLAMLPPCASAQSHLLDEFSPLEIISVGETMVLRVPEDASIESIQAWVDRAVDQSSSDRTVKLEFAPGASYRVGVRDGDTVVRVGRTKSGNTPTNLVIDGRGCAFTVTSWSRFLSISQVRNVILRNFRVTYDPKNITQGVLTRVIDASPGIYEVEIDPAIHSRTGPALRLLNSNGPSSCASTRTDHGG